MTKHILCAIDLTHEGDAAHLLREADKLATFYGANLSVVTVLPDYGSSWVGSFFKDGSLKEALSAADKALHELVLTVLPERRGVQHIVEVGVAYEQVLKSIEVCGADLVIVGAHKPDIADAVLGPNSARIARSASISTLIIRVPG